MPKNKKNNPIWSERINDLERIFKVLKLILKCYLSKKLSLLKLKIKLFGA